MSAERRDPVSGAVLPRDLRRAKGAAFVAAVALLVLLAWLRPNPFAQPQTVRAVFADAGALATVGAEVRIAGTPVGEVVGRERRGRLALVTMELDDEAGAVRRDARAELRPRLLFEGTAYVDLEPGSPGVAVLDDGTIPVQRTRTAVSATDAAGLLDRPRRTALRTGLRELSETLRPPTATAANDVLRQAAPLARGLGTVADAARGVDGDGLRRAVAGMSRTARTVAARSDDLIALAADTETVAGAALAAGDAGSATDDGAAGDAPFAGDDGVALDAALAGLPATVAAVREGGDAAAAVLRRGRPVVLAAKPAARRLGPTLAAVEPLLRDAPPVLGRTAPLVADGRAALASGARAARDARAALAAADGLSRTLDGGLLTALERPTRLGTPAYLSFLGLFAGGGGASRPFVPGEGKFMRFGFRFLTGVGAPVPPCRLLDRAAPQLAEQLAQAGGCQR